MTAGTTLPTRDAPVPPAAREGIVTRLWRRRGVFLAVFAAVLGLAVAALLVIPVRYVATGAIIVAEPEPGDTGGSAVWAQKLGDPADLESQLLLVRSPRILRLLVAQADLAEAARAECRAEAGGPLALVAGTDRAGSRCDALQPGSEALLDYLEHRLGVGNVGRSRVIAVSYTSPHPDTARRMANALITAFLDDQRRTLAQGREAAASWIWAELRQLDTTIREAQDRIEAERRRRGLVRGSTAPIASERLTSIGQQLAHAETTRAEAAARLREIDADQARGSADSPAVLASRTVGDLKQQHTQISAQLANLEMTLGPAHPTIKSLQRERDLLSARLKREVGSVAASARQVHDAAAALVATLRRDLDAAKGEVAAAMNAQALVDGMERDLEIKRAQYADLYKRASDLETQRRVLVGSTRLVNLAETPTQPFFPKRLPFLAAGLTLAVLLGAAAALLRDGTDRTLRSPGALEREAGAPTLAALPRLRAGVLHDRTPPLRAALALAGKDPAFQAALRTLAAGLAIRPLRILLVTSARPGEGKTLTALALAARAGALGRRVLVIEGDLCAPGIAAALDLPPGPGLLGVLRGELPVGRAVLGSRLPNVDVLPAGGTVDGSAELLTGPHAAGLLAQAETYDLVLIDSPALGVALDASLLARRADAVLVCARWGRSRIEATASAVATLRAAGGTVAGAVVTEAPASRPGALAGRVLPPLASLEAAR
ncbi:GumC family protein [Methylobacterium sp. JK268]